jgi:hypothetical protein
MVNDKLHNIRPAVAPTDYRVILHPVYHDDEAVEPVLDRFVVEVIVPQGSGELYFTGSNETFVKTDAGRKKLSGPEMTAEALKRQRVADDLLLVYLLDQAVRFSLDIPSWNLDTFGERWRLIELVGRLIQRAEDLLPALGSTLSPTVHEELVHYIREVLRWYWGEAKLATPRPGEEGTPQYDGEHFKAARFQLPRWDALREKIISRPGLKRSLAELHASPGRWTLLDFPSEGAFREWLAPTSKSIGLSTTLMQDALLRRLCEGANSVLQLEEEGFPKADIVEVLNRLLRDKWIELEYDSIRLSKIGKTLLVERLKGLD